MAALDPLNPLAKPIKAAPLPNQNTGFYGPNGGPQVAPIGGQATDSVGMPSTMPLAPLGPIDATPATHGPLDDWGGTGMQTATKSTPSFLQQDPAAPAAPANDFWASVRAIQDLSAGRGASDGPIPAAGDIGVRPPAFSMTAAGMPTATGPTGTPTNPGVTLGTQAAWNGGPNVTTSRVGYDALPGLETDFSEAAQRGADAAYKGATQFFNEDFSKDRAARESQLQAMGFAPGSAAYNAELDRMERGQNAARENAGFMAQGVGHQQAGDLLARALQSRAALVGERSADADRTYAQSLGIANLGLGARAQDKGVEQAGISAAASANAANAAAESNRYSTDANTTVALRRLGLDQGNQDFNQLSQLLTLSRNGVNMPNFGTPTPVDVGTANSIASGNANSAAARTASDRAALASLGASALGSIPWGSIFGGP